MHPLTTFRLIAAGAVSALVTIAAARCLATRLARHRAWRGESLVYAVALIAAAGLYVIWVRGASLADVTRECMGLAIFTGFALIGLRRSFLLAAGWLLHPLWDWGLHPPPTASWLPAWFPAFCIGFDLLLAAYIAARSATSDH
jgi:hypothetical protein